MDDPKVKQWGQWPWSVRLATICLWGFIPAGMAIAFSTPDDILENDFANGFVAIVSAVVPFVANVGQASPIPEVAKFFSAVMWTLAVVVTAVLVTPHMVLHEYHPWRKRFLNFQGKRVKLIFTVLVLIAFLLFVYFYPGNPGRRYTLMFGSRFGLGLFGSLFILVVPISAGFLITAAFYWKRVWAPRPP